jgi:hypothetical protein
MELASVTLSPASQYVKNHIDSIWSRHIPVLVHLTGSFCPCPGVGRRHSTDKGDIGRYRLFTASISSLPSWPRTALDRVPRHPATPRRWAELMPPFANPGAALPNSSYTKTRISGQIAVQRAKPAVGDWNAEGTFWL